MSKCQDIVSLIRNQSLDLISYNYVLEFHFLHK